MDVYHQLVETLHGIRDGNADLSALHALCDEGCDLNVRNFCGHTIAHIAVELGLAPVIPMLAAHGCDLNAKNVIGQTPAHFAVQSGQVDAVYQLAAHGASFLEADEEGNHPITLARNREGTLASAVARVTLEQLRARVKAGPGAYSSGQAWQAEMERLQSLLQESFGHLCEI
jgi:ankyrin repeat protein